MKPEIQNPKSKKSFLSFELLTFDFSHTGGFTLFYAMLISSLLLSVGLAIFNITYKEFILTAGVRESEGAFYAADSALECALYWDYIHGNSGTPAFGFYGDSLASGLAGYWRFEEGDTNFDKAIDSSGQGNQGTVIGGQTRADGYIGNALAFNGSGDYMNVGHVRGLSFSDGEETSHTVSAWVYINNLPSGESKVPPKEWILLIGEDTSGHGWTIDSTGTFSAGDQNGGTTVTGALGTGAWHHVVITYGGSELDGYIDGEVFDAKKAASLFSGLNGTQPLTLGKPFPEEGDDVFLDGMLDDVRIYNRVLSVAEIEKLHEGSPHNEFVPPVPQYVDNKEGTAGIQLSCSEQVINDPNTGWNTDEKGQNKGWDVVTDENNPNYSQTTFDMTFSDDTCALVTVTKQAASETISSTEIISRGYNTCSMSSTRRLERALKATY